MAMTTMTARTNSTGLFPAVLQTERLYLRAITPDDSEEVFSRYASDPEVTRYLSWPTHRTIEDTRTFLMERTPETRAPGGEIWIIEPLRGGPLLGAIGARVYYDCRVDFGYSLARDAWGHGYATEAAAAVVAAALAIDQIWRVQAMCDVEHQRSAQVLLKIGLTYEGTLRRYCILPNRSDEPRDMLCFAKVRE
jgi:[ribosomal protein S5]-alanine N-acetyltransferase